MELSRPSSRDPDEKVGVSSDALKIAGPEETPGPFSSAGTRLEGLRYPFMLKLAGVFLVVMIIAGILGFVVDVAGFAARLAFFVCLIGLAVTLAARALRKS